MLRRIASLLAQRSQSKATKEITDELELTRRVKSLEIDLADRDKTIVALRNDLQRVCDNAESQIKDSTRSSIEALIGSVAPPVSQFLTQKHIHQNTDREIKVDDVLAVVHRLIRGLEDIGLQVQGKVGENVLFDPNYHQTLSREHSIKSGKEVVVKFSGIGFGDKVIQKAGVEPIGS